VILFFSSCYKDDIDLLKKQIVILQTKIDSLSNALSVNTYQIQKRADSLSSALNVTNSKLNQTNLSIANATKSNIKSTGLHEHIFQRTWDGMPPSWAERKCPLTYHLSKQILNFAAQLNSNRIGHYLYQL